MAELGDNERSGILISLFSTASAVGKTFLAVNMAAVLVLHRYGVSHGKKERLFLTAASYLAAVYGMTLYPAWQIPLGWLFLFLALYPLGRSVNRRSPDRTDLWCGLLALSFLGAVFWHVWSLSGPSIEAIRQTVYPGHRFVTGGALAVREIFTAPLALFMPFTEFSHPYLNFNMVSFWDLAPLGWILALRGMIRDRLKDALTAGLMAVQAVFLAFCFLPWPSWLVRGTLLFAVPEGRLIIPLSLINLMILVRGLALYPLPWKRGTAFFTAAACTALSLWAVFSYCPDAYSLRNGLVLAAVSGAGFLAVLRYRRYLGPYMMGLFLVVGGMVNPVARGVSSVYGTELAADISSVVSGDPGGRWIVSDETLFLNNYPAVFGAPVVNTFMVHPAWSVWKKLSLTEEQRSVLNRCAHIIIKEITEEDTKMTLQHGDVISMTLSREDLLRLEIRHILTQDAALDRLDTDGMEFLPEARTGKWIIYEVRRTGA